MCNFKKVVLSASLVLTLSASSDALVMRPSAHAAEMTELSRSEVVLANGAGRVVKLPANAASLFSADPKVAEVRPASPRSFFIFGVGPGNTTVEATNTEGDVIARYIVHIVASNYNAALLKQKYGATTPDVSLVPLPDGMGIEGQAPDPQTAQKLVDHAKSLAGKDGYVADYMTVPGSIQVNLRVRIVEMDRALVRELGVEWQNVNALGTSVAMTAATQSPLAAATTLQSSVGIASRFHAAGTQVTMETVIDALAQDGLVRSLAEPNLTAISGQPASFLVGGEYPIPTSSYGGSSNVQFKQYGVSLGFVPTVLADGRINLHVRPEVSALSSDGAVTYQSGSNSMQIPAITVRRADTVVELGSGQSFIIAGLLSDSTKINTTGLPWLGDIPILGALFKSSSFQKNESELVIIVTPYLVHPVDNISELHTPDEGWVAPTDLERIFLMRQSGTDVRKKRSWQKMDTGNAGFMVE